MAGAANMVPDEQAPELTAEQARLLHCYACGNDDAYELREIEEPVTVGQNTAIVRIHAAVCRFCGERLLDLPNRARLEEVRSRLERGEVAGFEPVGLTYRVP
ncbi:MAG TPA: YgiT-type zinc finger protein [Ktedonobacterales bacterium]|jgi:YgiT-type zinc finger domain-containing protein